MRFLATVFLILHSLSVAALDITSHKTAGLEYSENTLEGFVYSLTLNVDAIEVDLHLTRDGVLVLSHDPVLDNKNCFDAESSQHLIIAQATLKAIQALSCIDHVLNKRRYQVPTFEAILHAYADSGRGDMVLNVEVKMLDKKIKNSPRYESLDKDVFHYSDEAMTNAVYAALRTAGINNNILLTSFSRSMLISLKQARADDEAFTFGLLFKGSYAPIRLAIPAWFYDLACHESCWWPNWKEARAWVIENNIDVFLPNWSQLSHPFFRRGFRRVFQEQPSPFRIHPWTLNTQKEWALFTEYQQRPYPLDGIITDRPSTLLLQRSR